MLKKVSLTYHAPKGDSKTCEEGGVTLLDGTAADVVLDEARIEKLRGNPCFEVGKVSDHDQPSPAKQHDKPPEAKQNEPPPKEDAERVRK